MNTGSKQEIKNTEEKTTTPVRTGTATTAKSQVDIAKEDELRKQRLEEDWANVGRYE